MVSSFSSVKSIKKFQVPGSKFQVHRQSRSLSNRDLKLGTWNLDPGTWIQTTGYGDLVRRPEGAARPRANSLTLSRNPGGIACLWQSDRRPFKGDLQDFVHAL